LVALLLLLHGSKHQRLGLAGPPPPPRPTGAGGDRWRVATGTAKHRSTPMKGAPQSNSKQPSEWKKEGFAIATQWPRGAHSGY
jgi:hypothetical protein